MQTAQGKIGGPADAWAPFQVSISKDEMRVETQPREIN